MKAMLRQGALALALTGIGSFGLPGIPGPGLLRAQDPDAKAIAASEAALPNDSVKESFAEETPIRFVTVSQNRKVWEGLKSYWNETTEMAVDPVSGKPVQKKVVLIKVPLGLSKAPEIPTTNPMTLSKFELGKKLYFDKIISSNNTVSCASCHNPDLGYTDQSKVSTGINDNKGGVSAPTVFNSAYNTLQFWDGRAASLELQAQGPPQNSKEMWDGKGHAWFAVIERLKSKPDYVKHFEKAFGHGPTRDAVAKAIATYERAVLTGNAVADRAEVAMRERLEEEDTKGKPALEGRDVEKVLKKAVEAKEADVISAFGLTDGGDAKIKELGASIARGKEIFVGKARCASCHAGDNFSDNEFHNLGVGVVDGKLGEGDHFRFGAQPTGHKNPELVGATKTPTLRQLLSTAPYLHDGSEATLESVVDFYDRGGNANAYLDIKMRDFEAEKAWMKAKAEGKTPEGPAPFLTPEGKPIIPLKLGLTKQEKADLVNYLKALNGSGPDRVLTQS